MPDPSNSVTGMTQSEDDHWQARLRGHGLAYFRELVVEYKTLQWVNPFAATAIATRREADEKAAHVAKAEEALKKTISPAAPLPVALPVAEDPALKKLLEDAKTAAAMAQQAAVLAAAKQAAAENARMAADKIINELIAKSDKKEATWSDLLEFESALLRLVTGEKLRARYESMAVEYGDLIGVGAAEAPKEEDALRAKAETLLAD